MRNNKLSNIVCKGRYSRVKNLLPCETEFSHIGHWGDKELKEHEQLEQSKDCHEHWHIGFEEDGKFQKLKENIDTLREETGDDG